MNKIDFDQLEIEGPHADQYRPYIEQLIQGIIPEKWEKISSSKQTIVIRQKFPSVYYKEYLPRSKIERLKSLIKGDRALRAMKQGKLLIEKGLNTPEMLCWGSLGGRSFIMFEAQRIPFKKHKSFLICIFQFLNKLVSVKLFYQFGIGPQNILVDIYNCKH